MRYPKYALGDRVLLQWNGYPGVPRAANLSEATVLGYGRTLYVVGDCPAWLGTMRVRPDQIRRLVDPVRTRSAEVQPKEQ